MQKGAASLPDEAWRSGCRFPTSSLHLARISSLHSSVVERQSCKLKVLGSVQSGGSSSRLQWDFFVVRARFLLETPRPHIRFGCARKICRGCEVSCWLGTLIVSQVASLRRLFSNSLLAPTADCKLQAPCEHRAHDHTFTKRMLY